jgi:hypothetical protein
MATLKLKNGKWVLEETEEEKAVEQKPKKGKKSQK